MFSRHIKCSTPQVCRFKFLFHLGPEGSTGPTGDRGIPGIPGETGDKGDSGERGGPGQTGDYNISKLISMSR